MPTSLSAQKEIAAWHHTTGQDFYDFSMSDSAAYHLGLADSLYGVLEMWPEQMECKLGLVKAQFNNIQHTQADKAIDESIAYGIEKLPLDKDRASIGVLYAYKGIIHFLLNQNIESAMEQIDIGFEILKKTDRFQSEEWVCFHHKSLIYYFVGKLPEAKLASKTALEKMAFSPARTTGGFAVIHNVLGALYRKEKQYKKSIEQYLLAVKDFETFEATQDKYNLDRIKTNPYHNLGNVYYEIGEYEKSLEYLRKVLVLHKKTLPENDRRIGASYVSIGNVLYNQADYEGALVQFNRAEEILVPSPNLFFQSMIFHNKGNCYRFLGDPQKALDYLHKALQIRSNTPGLDPSLAAQTQIVLAYLYKDMKNYEKAEEMAKKGIAAYEEHFGKYDGEVAAAYNSLAHVYTAMQDYDQALGALQQSLIHNFPNLPASFPVEAIPDTTYFLHPKVYTESLQRKARCFYQLYLKSKDIKYLKIAEQHYKKCDELITVARLQRDRTEDQIKFNENTHFTYQEAVAVAHELYQLEKNPAYFEQALYYSERSKTQALQANLTKNNVLNSLGIAEDLHEAEKSLRDSISMIKEKLALQKEDIGLTSKQGLEEKLFAHRQAYDVLMQKIATKYPAYYTLTHSDSPILLKEIQKELLNGKRQLVEYFIGTEQIHIFLISANDFSWHTKALPDAFEQQIGSFLAALYDNHILQYSGQSITDDQKKKADQDYATLGHQLHELLLGALPENSNISEYIIVPDGILGMIPYEALLTKKPKTMGAYNDYPYLLHQKQISYTYSATLLQQLQNKVIPKSINRELLSFAPQFSDCSAEAFLRSVQSLRSNYFGAIQNEAEVLAIQEVVGGKTMLHQEANLMNFLSQGPQYAYLHIASHAKANDQNPALSMIGLSAKENIDCLFDTLSATRIANLSLPTEMIVLSACEGATGQLHQGEGIQSLAMAFTYAGAKSLCTTLWSVQDKATADIMTNYYRHLNDGLSKDEALNKAKLNYLTEHDNSLSHPFYWAAPILIGDAQSISFSTAGFNIPFWAYLALGLVVLFFLLRRKRAH